MHRCSTRPRLGYTQSGVSSPVQLGRSALLLVLRCVHIHICRSITRRGVARYTANRPGYCLASLYEITSIISQARFDSFAPAYSAFRPSRLCRGSPARSSDSLISQSLTLRAIRLRRGSPGRSIHQRWPILFSLDDARERPIASAGTGS